ncbi:hypothetical protein NUW58_g1636 [Xylaria curta]|uniref:Uncharacterized protein n=1 Tax=Xylaria curta TaxID=42375 RepID=A0ACC1PJE2_9PEZI|nr:hypothetical protein NUW58_g1636 [Xylaria curta]
MARLSAKSSFFSGKGRRMWESLSGGAADGIFYTVLVAGLPSIALECWRRLDYFAKRSGGSFSAINCLLLTMAALYFELLCLVLNFCSHYAASCQHSPIFDSEEYRRLSVTIMNVYESKRLKYVPIGEPGYESFLCDLLQEPGTLNFDTSLPVGFTMPQMSVVTREMANRKLLSIKPEERHVHHGSSSLSLMIVSKHQRKGYGQEAIAWALDWAFDFARLHRVEMACYGWNPGAKRLYSRIGFREEGVKREAIWFMGGWHDMHDMAILEHEWREKWRDAANAETFAPADGESYSSGQIAEKMGSA